MSREWFGCFFGHKWTKWITVGTGKTDNGWPVSVQERECQRCGLRQQNTVW